MKIDFIDSEIKKQYKSIVNNHVAALYVIDELPKIAEKLSVNNDKKNKGKIVDVTIGTSFACITVLIDNIPFDININYDDKKIKIASIKLPYKIVYDDYPKKYFIPNGYEYQKEDRIVFHKYLTRLNPTYANMYLFKMTCVKNEYNISIEADSGWFNKKDFIQKLLDIESNISSIKNLMLILSQILDLKKCKIKVVDRDNNKIMINHGVLVDYYEYRRNENEKQRIFFENDEFYVERIICEKDQGEVSSYIKKLGVYNGKEKKSN